MSMSSPSSTAGASHHAGQYRVTRVVLMITGGLAAFLGLFIMFGSGDQSIGIGGEVSWQVDEIAPGWGYGLLAAGLVLLVGGIVLTVRSHRLPAAERAADSGWSDVLARHGSMPLADAMPAIARGPSQAQPSLQVLTGPARSELTDSFGKAAGRR